MTKRHYLQELDSQLYFLADGERADALREFESHIDDTAATRTDLTEEQVVDRLPPPASVAARYYAETGESGEAGAEGGAESDQDGKSGRGRRSGGGFTLGGLGSMFRFARREERELSGDADGVERVVVSCPTCDVSASPGGRFSYVVRGRWDDGDEPELARDGGVWTMRCSGSADTLELTLPDSVVELIVSTASGDVSADLPPGASLKAKLASGDVSCRSDGGAVEIATSSGDISVKGRPADVRVGTVSGDVSVHGAEGDVEAATQSGDISVSAAGAGADIAARTMSGDVSVSLPAGARPAVRAESVSGDIDAPGADGSRGPAGRVVVADGGPGSVVAKSVSGDIAIR